VDNVESPFRVLEGPRQGRVWLNPSRLLTHVNKVCLGHLKPSDIYARLRALDAEPHQFRLSSCNSSIQLWGVPEGLLGFEGEDEEE
jgi:hypothetical protein